MNSMKSSMSVLQSSERFQSEIPSSSSISNALLDYGFAGQSLGREGETTNIKREKCNWDGFSRRIIVFEFVNFAGS